MVLTKVVVGREQVSLVFSRAGLLRLLGPEDLTTTVEPDEYEIELAVSLQRCGIESKLIVAGKDPGLAHSINPAINNRNNHAAYAIF
jgi:hypothetical protein